MSRIEHGQLSSGAADHVGESSFGLSSRSSRESKGVLLPRPVFHGSFESWIGLMALV